MLKFIDGIISKLKGKNKVSEVKEKIFIRNRCPKCNSLLFEKEENTYTPGSVRIKCRMCKEILVL